MTGRYGILVQLLRIKMIRLMSPNYSILKISAFQPLDERNGFTLIELIVVVAIIGILAAIAIPSFQSSAAKARQREASTLLAGYAKATQGFIAEHGFVPRTSVDVGQFISVTGCGGPDPVLCKTSNYGSVNYSINPRSVWYSHSGVFEIRMHSYPNNRVIFTATPSQWSPGNLGVSACVNINGTTRLLEGNTQNAPSITC